MARSVPQEVTDARPIRGAIGGQLLEIITAGMYSDPRMVLREYIQNAVDSIDLAEELGVLHQRGRVEVRFDGRTRTITVEDNGAGVGNAELVQRLGTLGCSCKEGTSRRGFRGIGRLGGVAYCGQVIFETRTSARERVGVVKWDGGVVRDMLKNQKSQVGLSEVIQKAATVAFKEGGQAAPSRFFRTTMLDVHRFHRDELMDVASASSYLEQVAPVPFDARLFSFAGKLEERLSRIPGYKTYDVLVNGRKLFRPHRDEFIVRKGRLDRVRDVEAFDLTGVEGSLIGCGWYARTGLVAALPPRQTMRGIRVRQGNIEVGDEHFLSQFFTERRFSTWHIGEIHLDNQVRPNARRDGFEQSPDLERFLEQVHLLGKHLSGLCRQSSDDRTSTSSLGGQLSKLEHSLQTNLFLDESQLASTLTTARTLLAKAELAATRLNVNGELRDRIEKARASLASVEARPVYVRDSLDSRCLRHLDHKDLLVGVCAAVVREYPASSSAQELVCRLLAPYLKPGAAHSLDGFDPR